MRHASIAIKSSSSLIALNAMLALLVLLCGDQIAAILIPDRLPHAGPFPFTLLLAILFAANAAAIVAIGAIMIFPVLLDGVGMDERKIARLLIRISSISKDSRDTVLAVVRREAAAARLRASRGRLLLLIGGICLTLSVPALCGALKTTSPQSEFFVRGTHAIANSAVSSGEIWRFIGDQISGALMLDFPELYDFHVGDLDNNVHARLFTDLIFAFRSILGWIALTCIIVSIRLHRTRLRPHEVKAFSAAQSRKWRR